MLKNITGRGKVYAIREQSTRIIFVSSQHTMKTAVKVESYLYPGDRQMVNNFVIRLHFKNNLVRILKFRQYGRFNGWTFEVTIKGR